MEQQLDMFPHIEKNCSLSREDIINHRARMVNQVLNKSGAISRLVRARYDDVMAAQIAEENLVLRKEIASLKEDHAEGTLQLV